MPWPDFRLQNALKSSIPSITKDLLKHFVWATLCSHRNTQPPIFLFTSRRSGGTWLAETLAHQPGVLFVNEPTETGKYDFLLRRRGVFPARILEQEGIACSDADRSWLLSFLHDIVDGDLTLRQPWNPTSPTFHRRTQRVVIKTHVTKPYIQAITADFPGSTAIWLLRHPIPQAKSAIKAGSVICAPRYLQIGPVAQALTTRQDRLCKEILARGDAFECYVLDWCLETLVPWQLRDRIAGLIRLTYEQLVTERTEVLAKLEDALGMAGLTQHAAQDRASASTRERTKARAIALAAGGDQAARAALVGAWVDKTSEREFERCQRLLDAFEIDLFSARDPLPGR